MSNFLGLVIYQNKHTSSEKPKNTFHLLFIFDIIYSEKSQALSRLATLHASSIYQFLAVLHIVPSSCGQKSQINGEQTFDQNSDVKIGNLAVFFPGNASTSSFIYACQAFRHRLNQCRIRQENFDFIFLLLARFFETRLLEHLTNMHANLFKSLCYKIDESAL